ncbi:hypothetical protein JCM16777_1129 [Leptotrichia wadei]|uniref:Uncharacterized protein n=1 Tax=Leptotrichia wadei TaxID=157687 RepID=A0A7U6LAK3_9FUSO|nr:hypothetical protein [Leptotrichia wadei]BBM42879.1 hypothetical protein JCM16777_1129 [Leptotrichia wadei]
MEKEEYLFRILISQVLDSLNPELKFKNLKKDINNGFIPFELEGLEKDLQLIMKDLEIISFEDNQIEDSKIFKLPNNQGKIIVSKLADYEKRKFFNKLRDIDYVVEMDTNIVSYLDRFYKNQLTKEDEKLKLDIVRIIEDLDKKRENFLLGSCNLYIIESIMRDKEIDEEIILDSVNSVEYLINFGYKKKLKDITLKQVVNNIKNRIIYIIKRKQRVKNIKNRISHIREIKNQYVDRNLLIYCLILKSFYIKITIPNINKRIEELINFINNELYYYMENETLLCITYLLDAENQKFFGKINKNLRNTKEKIEIEKIKGYIKGMVWDLSHLRILQEINIKEHKNGKIQLPVILSADEGLNEIINFNKIKKFCFFEKYRIPVYEKNIKTYTKNYKHKNKKISKNIPLMIEKLESEEMLTRERKRTRNSKFYYNKLADKIYTEIVNFISNK